MRGFLVAFLFFPFPSFLLSPERERETGHMRERGVEASHGDIQSQSSYLL